MRIRPASAATAFALSTLALTGLASPAVAQTPVCEPYSTNCPTPPPEPPEVIPTVTDKGTPPPANVVRDRDRDRDCPDPAVGTTSTGGTGSADDDCTTVASTLPFTGGELVLMTAVGAGALAGGVALVAAGRRRKPAVA